MSSELFDAIQYLEKEKGINKEVLMDALEAALISAYKKNFKSATNVRVDLNEESGSMHVYARKDVVEEVEDKQQQISLEEATQINPNYELGDVIEMEVTPKDFGRIAAQAAKQVVTQRVREAERGVIFSEYADREEDVMTGIIQRKDPRFVYVNLGKIEAKLAGSGACTEILERSPASRATDLISTMPSYISGTSISKSSIIISLTVRLKKICAPLVVGFTSLIKALKRSFFLTDSLGIKSNLKIMPSTPPMST